MKSLFQDHSAAFCNLSPDWLTAAVDSYDPIPDRLIVDAEVVCNFLFGAAVTSDPECRAVN